MARTWLIMAGTWALLTACGGDTRDADEPPHPPILRPPGEQTVASASLDGISEDLLTAGLGRSGLQSERTPRPLNPLLPTAAELRRLAIYQGYRSMVDITTAGGYGSLYGPNVDANGVATNSEGLIAGSEFLAFSDDGTGRQNVTMLVQIPNSFNAASPCLLAVAAPGSQGVYAGITVAEWGLKRGCAVAIHDKGAGPSPHDLATDTVGDLTGARLPAIMAGSTAAFRLEAGINTPTFNFNSPFRVAFKHAHSRLNPQRDWGSQTLRTIEFAFRMLNQQFRGIAPTFTAANTLVIGAGVSNGGAAILAAAEADANGLIDGLVVAAPTPNLPVEPGFEILRGTSRVPVIARSLFDVSTFANLFQPCAALAASVRDAPALRFLDSTLAANRCAGLRERGLLNSLNLADQANEALQALRDYGWEPETDLLHASMAAFEISLGVALTNANALARARVTDALCGYSFAAIDLLGRPTPIDAQTLAQMFALGSGSPPTATVQIINDQPSGRAARNLTSVSPSSARQDMNLDGALCLRNLLTGTSAEARALQTGLDETRLTGKLRGKPALIVHGRADVLAPVNHTSRAYFGLNQRVEGGASGLSYLEVENAQHFDAFIGMLTFAGYDTRYIPLHVYFLRALDAMFDRLLLGRPLPESQVVRTQPRGGVPGVAPQITALNVPPIPRVPASGDQINFIAGSVTVPD